VVAEVLADVELLDLAVAGELVVDLLVELVELLLDLLRVELRRVPAGRRDLRPEWKSKFYGAFVLNHRVVLHAIDATPARWPPRCVAYTSADEATLLPAPEGVFQ